jgi:hypothetical protein
LGCDCAIHHLIVELVKNAYGIISPSWGMSLGQQNRVTMKNALLNKAKIINTELHPHKTQFLAHDKS